MCLGTSDRPTVAYRRRQASNKHHKTGIENCGLPRQGDLLFPEGITFRPCHQWQFVTHHKFRVVIGPPYSLDESRRHPLALLLAAPVPLRLLYCHFRHLRTRLPHSQPGTAEDLWTGV